ncbi:MAG: tRNA-guanine transglycosylase, partial [Anaerolineae bacterium]|nr:tRNA-guanine transglycosylase [Anaerolineae bacterium]
KPRYLMGVGDPDDLVNGIYRGVDIFDCVIPTRLARHGAALTHHGRINMKRLAYATDAAPVESGCTCYCCTHFSRAYIRHLLKAEEILAAYLLSIHNIHFLIEHVRTMREAILAGTFTEYMDTFLEQYFKTA